MKQYQLSLLDKGEGPNATINSQVDKMSLECLSENFSTTRRVQRDATAFCIFPDVNSVKMLSLPTHPQRKGDGGLRAKGYFKVGIRSAVNAKNVDSRSIDQQKPLITVITVVFNGAQTLERSILSVINQTYDNVEYVIVDGGSTDGTLDLIRRYEHAIDYWVSEPDSGIYDAWNKAAGLSLGDWCIFLGADDQLVADDVLEEIHSRDVLSPVNYQLVYGKLQIISPSTGMLLEELGQPWEEMSKEFEFFHPKLPKFPEVLIHCSLLAGKKTFDKAYRIAGDTKFLLGSLASGARIKYMDLPVSKMGLGGVSSDPEKLWATSSEVRRICRELGIKVPISYFAREWIKLFLKVILIRVLPARIYFACVNLFRAISGRAPIWNRS